MPKHGNASLHVRLYNMAIAHKNYQTMFVWSGYGSKRKPLWTTGFGKFFLLPVGVFRYPVFLTHTQVKETNLWSHKRNPLLHSTRIPAMAWYLWMNSALPRQKRGLSIIRECSLLGKNIEQQSPFEDLKVWHDFGGLNRLLITMYIPYAQQANSLASEYVTRLKLNHSTMNPVIIEPLAPLANPWV